MIRATSVVRRPAVRDERVADVLTLDHQARFCRRFAFTAEGGLAFLLDLDKAAMLDDGDAVKLEDGRLVRITAAPEHLVEVRAANPLRLLKVAWHLGNRHVAAEITADAIYFAGDHVLEEMVRGLGASVIAVVRPFRPEKGASEAAAAHGGHGPAGHDHAGHDHGNHDHGDHDHAGHDHADHDHASHAHGGHHAHHGHACAQGEGGDGVEGGHDCAGHDHATHHAHGGDGHGPGCGHEHHEHHEHHPHGAQDHAHRGKGGSGPAQG